MLKAVGTTDERDTCEKCGKAGLKRTVVLRDEDGDFRFYGTTCAARALGGRAETKARAEKTVHGALYEYEQEKHAEKLAAKLATADALAELLGWDYKPSERWNVYAAGWLRTVAPKVVERLEGKPKELLSRLLELQGA